MSPQLVLFIINIAQDKRVRNIIIGTIIGIFLLVFVPIMYFFTVDPLAIGLKGQSKAYKNTQPIQTNMSQNEFIEMVGQGAVQGEKKYKIFASITIAQAILESSWGNSGLTTKANNLFGIKAYNWTGSTIVMQTNEYYNGIKVTVDASFRAYDTPEESIEDHSKFLDENSTYRDNGVFDATTYEQQAEALQKAGYATDPDYPELLVELIREYNLDQYD